MPLKNRPETHEERRQTKPETLLNEENPRRAAAIPGA